MIPSKDAAKAGADETGSSTAAQEESACWLSCFPPTCATPNRSVEPPPPVTSSQEVSHSGERLKTPIERRVRPIGGGRAIRRGRARPIPRETDLRDNPSR